MFGLFETRSRVYGDGLPGDWTPAPCDSDVPQHIADLVWEDSGYLCGNCQRMASRVVIVGTKIVTRCEHCLKQNL